MLFPSVSVGFSGRGLVFVSCCVVGMFISFIIFSLVGVITLIFILGCFGFAGAFWDLVRGGFIRVCCGWVV